ncbi:MAG: hypothetical protein A2096_02300 [Spirochaetes bacterium GWF1_41_5]|nr:MAG: hypothetical protein A2096_02300 [Spirochaetes bacterium GWF1_41_5]
MPENNYVKVTAIGGVEEIGRNCYVMECGQDIIVIDAGIMFPRQDMFGIDLVIPDFSYLVQNKHKVKALIITHGHEDHIGAVSWFLKEIEVPVYAPRFAVALINKRLEEKNKKHTYRLIEIKPRSVIKAGCFHIEFIPVNHSIPDCMSLAITTPVGNILHTGDFKIDLTPEGGKPADLARFAYWGEKGVQLMLSDSTNSGVEGFTPSEQTLLHDMDNIVSSASGRLIFATFASNISRIQQIINLAEKYDRRIALSGRSMVDNIDIACRLGLIKVNKKIFIDIEKVKSLEPHKLLLITTGTQGEPMSSLMFMATDRHKHIRINETDTIILSSSIIPGNEMSIGKVVNKIVSKGAAVINDSRSDVHVSGHAAKEEQKILLHLVKPKYFIPIHGEPIHLRMHADTAKSMGIPAENIFILSNGSSAEFTSKKARMVSEKIPIRPIFIDGKGVGESYADIVHERSRLSDNGMIALICCVNNQKLEQTRIISRGFTDFTASENLKKNIIRIAEEQYSQHGQNRGIFIQSTIKKLKRYFLKELYKMPIIDIEVINYSGKE